jgi:hypothetical protein
MAENNYGNFKQPAVLSQVHDEPAALPPPLHWSDQEFRSGL